MKKELTPEMQQRLHELKNEVSRWVETFNYIQVDVLQLVAKENGSELFEYIDQPEITWEDIADYCGRYGDKKWIAKQKKLYANIYDHENYQDVEDSTRGSNYPMWNTCFEFKHEVSDKVVQAAKDVGLGVISGLGDFNTILFASSCGHSFYGAYWIPLYLNLPWNGHLKKEFENVSYDHL